MRRAEHFVMFLRRFVEYLKTRVSVTAVVSQSCSAFLDDVATGVAIDGKTLRFCYDRLTSLIKTLEIHNTDDFWPLQLVADFGTLIGTYDKGFAVIIEPWDDRLPSVPDPVIQLACLDASLAMKPVFEKFHVRCWRSPVAPTMLAARSKCSKYMYVDANMSLSGLGVFHGTLAHCVQAIMQLLARSGSEPGR